MKLQTAVSIGAALLSTLPSLVHGRELFYKVEASHEHYGSRGTCIAFKVPGNSLVTGKFTVRNPHSSVRASVLIYEGGNQPFSQQDLNGDARFSFRSRSEPAVYDACVRALPKGGAQSIPPGTYVQVSLDFKWNFDLFDEEMAKRMVLDPVKNEFFQLEEGIRRLDDELYDFFAHEAKHRSTSEATFDRVKYFSVLSIMVLVGLGVYQLWYLKRYFRYKKLI